MNKRFSIILLIVIFIPGMFFLWCSPILFQEGDLRPLLRGIVQLSIGNTGMVSLSGSDNTYMTKSKNGQEVIKNFMKSKGYEFTEQMGAGYLFKSSTGKNAVVTHRYYSRYYSLWKVTEDRNLPKLDVAEALKDCLPKSDMESYDTCKKLLNTINNFDDCVNAGFSIMKTNPPQCTTPNGRTFIETVR